MALQESDIKRVIDFVKKEPRSVQDIARELQRSWVTANTYVQQIKERTGLIDIKMFRKGTPASLKVVYYASPDAVPLDDLRDRLFQQIRNGREKTDFDFLDVFQCIPSSQKRAFLEEYASETVSTRQQLVPFLEQAKRHVYVFSGNLSFINMTEKKRPILGTLESMAKEGIRFHMLSRVNYASIANIERLSKVMAQYPESIEIRHCYQPLRGFIIDDAMARFKDEETMARYKKGELAKNTRIFYELRDAGWVNWLQKVFWHLSRTSASYPERLKEIESIF